MKENWYTGCCNTCGRFNIAIGRRDGDTEDIVQCRDCGSWEFLEDSWYSCWLIKAGSIEEACEELLKMDSRSDVDSYKSSVRKLTVCCEQEGQ